LLFIKSCSLTILGKDMRLISYGFLLVVLHMSVSLYAMEEQVLLNYVEDLPVYVTRARLNDTVKKFCTLVDKTQNIFEQQDPESDYNAKVRPCPKACALIWLKSQCGDDNEKRSIGEYYGSTLRDLDFYWKILLKQEGLLNEDNSVEPEIKKIVNAVIRVLPNEVQVQWPNAFATVVEQMPAVIIPQPQLAVVRRFEDDDDVDPAGDGAITVLE
jgi:hypothetical protein